MTTKEIAKATGKGESTVAKWVSRVSLKMKEVSLKMKEAKETSKPADYNLAETCQIIEEGMGKDVANTFRTNAVNADITAKSAVITAKSAVRIPAGTQLRELRLMVECKIITREQVQEILGFHGAKPDSTLAITAPIKPQARIAAPKTYSPIKSKSEGERRIAQACQIDIEKTFDPVILGATTTAIDRAIRLARLPKKQRYTQKEGHSLLWQLLFGKEINQEKNKVF